MWLFGARCPRGLLGLLVLAGGVLAVPAFAAVSGSAPPSKTQFGVHQDLTYDGYDWRRAKGIAAAAAIHAQISRNSLLWSKIETTPGTYDWSIPDSVVDSLRAKGIEPLFVVVGSPLWANGAAPGQPDNQYYVPAVHSILDLGQGVLGLPQEGSRSLQGPGLEVGDLERGE